MRLYLRFKDGERRYYEDYIFRKVIDSLERGANPLDVIDQLLDSLDKTNKAFGEYIKSGPSPQYIVADEETINRLKEQNNAK